MKSLAPPPIDENEVFRAISASRRSLPVRARLLDAADTIAVAYAAYGIDPNSVVALAPASTEPATAVDLRGNYDSRSRAARTLRGSILAHNAGGRCCLCAHRKVGTLDHYLPGSAFPEFSILPMNLVPACWDCNHEKGERYRGQAGEALFLHPYLDALPADTRFLYVDVKIVEAEPSVAYYVAPPIDLAEEVASRIRSHFEELGLAEYYLFEAANELSERRGAIEALWTSGASVDDVRDYLRREAESVAAAAGRNHWAFALLDALVAQPLIYVPAPAAGDPR